MLWASPPSSEVRIRSTFSGLGSATDPDFDGGRNCGTVRVQVCLATLRCVHVAVTVIDARGTYLRCFRDYRLRGGPAADRPAADRGA